MLPGGWDLHLPKVTVITPFRQASGRRVIQSVKNIRNLVAVESGYLPDIRCHFRDFGFGDGLHVRHS
jgi:hypothetical protein